MRSPNDYNGFRKKDACAYCRGACGAHRASGRPRKHDPKAHKDRETAVRRHEPCLQHIHRSRGNVVAKLPEEATDDDFDKAHIIQEQVYGLAGQVEEILIGESEIEDLGSGKDLINQVFAGLKEVETRLSEIERFAAKLKL